jgi:hypothetical protein
MNGYMCSNPPDDAVRSDTCTGLATSAGIHSVKTLLCTTDLPGGHSLAAAEGADGCLGIYLDGELLESAGRWPRTDVQQCIRAYLALRWERRLDLVGSS